MSWAVLQELGGKQMLVQLKGRVKVGKHLVNVSSGLDYHKLYKVTQGLPEEVKGLDSLIDGPITGDNKDFYDDNTAQTLTPDQIQEIKAKQGGEILIDKLVENSSTFQLKTQFAQEKHLSLFRVLEASSGNIANTLYINRSNKAIRSDALFNLLALANVHFYSKVLVSEYTGGVILGAVLEKTSYSVTSLYFEKVKDHALKYFGFGKKGSSRVVNSLLEDINEEFDCLIIAAKDDLAEKVEKLMPKLKGSGSFAAYSQDVNEAATVYESLMNSGNAANVALEEIWTREFQVLPERTHPDVQARIGTSGGYILSGTKIVN